MKAVTLGTFHVLNTHLWLVDPTLDSTVTELFCHHRKFWTVLVRQSQVFQA